MTFIIKPSPPTLERRAFTPFISLITAEFEQAQCMKHLLIHLTSCVALTLPMSAETKFQSIAVPGTVIAGHRFGRHTLIGNAAVNATGEVAFVAQWRKHGKPRAAIFTSKRIVAHDGDVFDGHRILSIPLGSFLQINASGAVFYNAITGLPNRPGHPTLHPTVIFVENRFASTPRLNSNGDQIDYELDKGGHLFFRETGELAIPKSRPALKTHASIWHRLFSTRSEIPRPPFDDSCDHSMDRPDRFTRAFPFNAINKHGWRVLATDTDGGFIVLRTEEHR